MCARPKQQLLVTWLRRTLVLSCHRYSTRGQRVVPASVQQPPLPCPLYIEHRCVCVSKPVGWEGDSLPLCVQWFCVMWANQELHLVRVWVVV